MTTFTKPAAIVSSQNDAEPPQIAASGSFVYIVWHEFPPGDNQPDVFFSRSTNKGVSFSAGLNLSNTTGVDSSNESIAVSHKDVYIAWSENASDIKFRRSTNNGGKFDPIQTLNLSSQSVLPQIATSGNNVYVVWQALGYNNQADIFFAESSNSGQTFSNEVNISKNNESSESPKIVVTDSRVVVTWRDQTTANIDFDIFFAQGK